jgi:hypothetical protein
MTDNEIESFFKNASKIGFDYPLFDNDFPSAISLIFWNPHEIDCINCIKHLKERFSKSELTIVLNKTAGDKMNFSLIADNPTAIINAENLLFDEYKFGQFNKNQPKNKPFNFFLHYHSHPNSFEEITELDPDSDSLRPIKVTRWRLQQ